ncbi:hypothetical protein RSP_0055 [Pseudomonas phage RSP]|nr:hypothetical protein RSP_0055 [Pseudomonas phage RSP]
MEEETKFSTPGFVDPKTKRLAVPAKVWAESALNDASDAWLYAPYAEEKSGEPFDKVAMLVPEEDGEGVRVIFANGGALDFPSLENLVVFVPQDPEAIEAGKTGPAAYALPFPVELLPE